MKYIQFHVVILFFMCMISDTKSLFSKLYDLPKDLSLSKLKLELGYPHCETPEELEFSSPPVALSAALTR